MSVTGSEENGCTDSHPTFFVGIGKWKCFDRADFPIRNGSSYLGLSDLATDTMCGLNGLRVITEVVGRGCYVPMLIAAGVWPFSMPTTMMGRLLVGTVAILPTKLSEKK